MEEIVVALRETRRGAGVTAPFAVVGGDRASQAAEKAETEDPVAIADLRDADIERLLAENARLNERVVFLLKVIEREQRRRTLVDEDRGAAIRDVRAALEAELRPILLAMLRLIEKHGASQAALGAAAARDGDCVVDLDWQHS